MAGTALFLGAGASKAFGLPLTSELFPRIIKRLNDGSLFDGNTDEQNTLREFIGNLYPGLNKIAEQDYPLITDTLSLLDHILNSGNSIWQKLKTQEILISRTLFEKAIFEVLKVPFRQHTGITGNNIPPLLKQFGEWIYKNQLKDFVSVISTNYDTTVEGELYSKFASAKISKSIDFGINWRDPASGDIHLRPDAPTMGIYKLHGATNWLKCNLCNHIYINTNGSIYHQAFRPVIDNENTCHCLHAPLSSLIVAPSLARVIYDHNLPHIWHNAFEKLRTASEWVIVGYSCPPEDLNIKSMLVRAFNARITKPKITIVQMGDAFKARYEAIFGNVTYLNEGLEQFMKLTA